MSGEPYLASEDSALLRRALSSYSGSSCLEIGAGNGGNLVELSKRFGLVVGTDIVRPDMDDWKKTGASYIVADCATCIRPEVFDLVLFNPPYLSEEATGDVTVEGGRDLRVPKRFLSEALRAVKREGTVIFLLNDQADPDEFEQLSSRSGFHIERVASERVFFEELSVYRATARPRKSS